MYETIDVAEVEQVLFSSNTDASAQNRTGSVEFRYTEYLVKTRSNGWIQFYEPTESEQA